MKHQLQPTQFLLYKSENGNIKVDVLVQDETVWLTQVQMGELEEKMVCAKFAHCSFRQACKVL